MASRNSIKVSVAKLSEDVIEITVKRGGTVKDALLKSGYEEDELDTVLEGVRVGGRATALNRKLRAGDFITISPRVQGGNR